MSNDHFEQLEIKTTIKEEKEGYYQFEDTIFYGNKGGMLADVGTINGLTVTDLKYDENEVLWHKVDGTLSNPIEMKVDRETRYMNTSVQTLFHAMDGYYRRKEGKYIIAIGVQAMNQWYEVNETVDEEELKNIQAYMDEVIWDDIPVEFSYVPGKDYPDSHYQHLNLVRVVKIGDYDEQPCGTLHVNHTGEIGSAVVLGAEKTSRGTRVLCTVGPATKQRFQLEHQYLMEASRQAGVKENELKDRIEKLQNDLKEKNKSEQTWKEKVLAFELEKVKKTNEKVIEIDGFTSKELASFLNPLLTDNREIAFVSKLNNQVHVALGSSNGNARVYLRSIQESMMIRGGGSLKLVSFQCEEAIESVIDKLKEVLG
ncbi:DHHA1 domain-containing protein [Bulleidia sp. zg-1006]|uniref:alanyl-tRNA editing protein n=1 Tax=Bulleidia sp. zg-1006 TaxID=2806552 RepID=UPI00193A3A30|nr:DHHA1 domain-containing protein [Bulleidia sp. zg-1006]QRG87021.1 hypothetical protein JOS54_01550 [Bulleidia sp. zg-1006]